VTPGLDLDAYHEDPAGWATSLANVAEVLLPCLEAVDARSVAEVGAYAGDLTRLLCDWAATRDEPVAVLAIDPSPQPALVALAEERDGLELVRRTSLEALRELDLPNVVIIDGDHNYWTVAEELRLIAERAPAATLPLMFLHDVAWPHARRDDYFDAEQIPPEYRQPVAGEAGGLFPGEPGLHEGGLPYRNSAQREGGPRNGVRTAVEDFVAARDGLRLAVVPAFFGLGVVWHEQADWAGRLETILAPWDDNSVVARLEAGRVHHLAAGHVLQSQLWEAGERRVRQEAVLRRMLESSAFGVAERLSRLRVRLGIAKSQSVVSKEEIRRALDDD
jgi:hypothetical protein